MEPLKMVLLGDSAVGKTSIIQRFVFNRFHDVVEPSLGSMFTIKCVKLLEENAEVQFRIWDTAGQEKYHSLNTKYYQDAAIAIIVYDSTLISTFEKVELWLKEVRNSAPDDVKVVVLGNKIDLVDKEEVDPQMVQDFAQKNNIKCSFVSAKTGVGIEELFIQLAKESLINKPKIHQARRESVMLANRTERLTNKPGCC